MRIITCIAVITAVVRVLMAVLVVMVEVLLAIIRPIVSVRVIIAITSTRRFAVLRASVRGIWFIVMGAVGVMMIEGVGKFGILIRHGWNLSIIRWWVPLLMVMVVVMVVLVGNIIGMGTKARLVSDRRSGRSRRHC